MHPILFQWGDIVLPSWHVFYVVGALAAYAVLIFLGKRVSNSIKAEDLSHVFVVCYLAGYFGARLLSILVEEPHVAGFGNTAAALLRFGPMTFYGGAIAAFIVGSIFSLVRKIPYREMTDLGLIAGFLALAIGRVGCFLNGDDYGRPVLRGSGDFFSSLGLIFPVLGDGIPRWPVQLFESISVFLLVLVMAVIKLYSNPRPGILGLLCIAIYANLRFALEFLRDDFRGFAFGTWLSTSQFIALLTLGVAGVIAPFWLREQRASQ